MEPEWPTWSVKRRVFGAERHSDGSFVDVRRHECRPHRSGRHGQSSCRIDRRAQAKGLPSRDVTIRSPPGGGIGTSASTRLATRISSRGAPMRAMTPCSARSARARERAKRWRPPISTRSAGASPATTGTRSSVRRQSVTVFHPHQPRQDESRASGIQVIRVAIQHLAVDDGVARRGVTEHIERIDDAQFW